MLPVDVIVPPRVYRSYAHEIAAIEPGLVPCVVTEDGVDPAPKNPRILLRTAEISGAEVGRLLRAYPGLEWIQLSSAGIDVVLPHLGEFRGILTNGAGLHTDAVSEWALGMIFAHARRLPLVLANSAGRRWQSDACDSVAGRTLGIIGAGLIGSRVAVKARALGMNTLGVHRRLLRQDRADGHVHEGFDQCFGPDGLGDLLAASHYVLVSTPLTRSTRGMIDEEVLSAMRTEAVLLNVARGGVVRTDHLMRALAGGSIAAAYLDVTDPEPLPESHPLWRLPNVVISAHSAWRAGRPLARIVDLFLENLRRWTKGQALANVVDPGRES